MFKMGCSMARKILAIDGKGSSSSNLNAGENSSSSKKSKDKQDASKAAATSGDELGDFSKLEQDPRIPLNVRQIFKITKSWKAIARTMSKTGTAMFLKFQHLKGTELHESMELKEHAATVMSTLDQSINSLSDYDNFVTYLHSIGKLHRKVPGFKRAHFWKIEQPFMKAVKQTLDERCNETIEEIYKIAIKLIIETIADGYGEDAEDTADDNNNNNNNNNKGGDSAAGGSGRSAPRPQDQRLGGPDSSAATATGTANQQMNGRNGLGSGHPTQCCDELASHRKLGANQFKPSNGKTTVGVNTSRAQPIDHRKPGCQATRSRCRYAAPEAGPEIPTRQLVGQAQGEMRLAGSSIERVEQIVEEEDDDDDNRADSSGLSETEQRRLAPLETTIDTGSKQDDVRLGETLFVLRELLSSAISGYSSGSSSSSVSVDRVDRERKDKKWAQVQARSEACNERCCRGSPENGGPNREVACENCVEEMGANDDPQYKSPLGANRREVKLTTYVYQSAAKTHKMIADHCRRNQQNDVAVVGSSGGNNIINNNSHQPEYSATRIHSGHELHTKKSQPCIISSSAPQMSPPQASPERKCKHHSNDRTSAGSAEVGPNLSDVCPLTCRWHQQFGDKLQSRLVLPSDHHNRRSGTEMESQTETKTETEREPERREGGTDCLAYDAIKDGINTVQGRSVGGLQQETQSSSMINLAKVHSVTSDDGLNCDQIATVKLTADKIYPINEHEQNQQNRAKTNITNSKQNLDLGLKDDKLKSLINVDLCDLTKLISLLMFTLTKRELNNQYKEGEEEDDDYETTENLARKLGSLEMKLLEQMATA